MSDLINLKNYHFLSFDTWFASLSEKNQDEIIENYGGLEKYLGVELTSENYSDETGFEFRIINYDRWNKAKSEHSFLEGI